MTNIKTAVCPFCRKYINTTVPIYHSITADTDKNELKLMIDGKLNLITCPLCGESFYYEHNFIILNSDKSYAVTVNAGNDYKLPEIRSSILNILGKENFRLRQTGEFIQAIEKVRIFECDLDDRVMEIIKYKYIPKECILNPNHKIILTGASDTSLEFTVFDGYDKPLSCHCVSSDAYHYEYSNLKNEILTAPIAKWRKTDRNWAEKHTKES